MLYTVKWPLLYAITHPLGGPINAIRICQKKTMRCIHNSVYNAHTDPLFRTSKILKFDDLYKLKVSKFVYDAMHV